MKTLLSKKVTPEVIEILRNGGLVSVPTETVYGLAGNALNEEAVQKIYEIKGRTEIKPLSILAFSYTHLRAHETKAKLVCRLRVE